MLLNSAHGFIAMLQEAALLDKKRYQQEVQEAGPQPKKQAQKPRTKVSELAVHLLTCRGDA